MQLLVIDYGMGNLGSVRRSLEECGGEVTISDDPRDLKTAAKLVLPGVGAFPDGMSQLRKGGWVERIREAVLESGVPVLGICLGMQLMAARGFEGAEVQGLGLLAGEVRRLEPDGPDSRIPHVGWNEVELRQENVLFNGVPNKSDFYFVHSYHFRPTRTEDVVGTTPYCGQFVSAVANKNIYGVQFHPEKSSRTGMRLLRNFIAL